LKVLSAGEMVAPSIEGRGGIPMRKILVASVLALATVLVASATAAQPTFTRVQVDDTFVDADLSAACGVPVTVHALGHITLREWDRDKGTVALNTINVAVTATAGDNSYRFRDVGADHLKITADGAVLSIIGQLPFDFTGVLKINIDTGEVVHEPSHDISSRVDDACDALTA
jgi:hypothetical protein